MKIAAYVKNSMTDYPGMIVDSIFLPFCNLRCSYCQNYALLRGMDNNNYIEEKFVFEKFENQKRGSYSDGICISGGEPSIHKYEVVDFIKEFKERFPTKKIKVDTNGTDPEFIELISGIVDFVSLDFKTLFFHRIEKYCDMNLAKFIESLENVKKCKDYNIRITMYPEYIKENEFRAIAEILKETKKVVVQQYDNRNTLCRKMEPYKDEIIDKMCKELQETVKKVGVSK